MPSSTLRVNFNGTWEHSEADAVAKIPGTRAASGSSEPSAFARSQDIRDLGEDHAPGIFGQHRESSTPPPIFAKSIDNLGSSAFERPEPRTAPRAVEIFGIFAAVLWLFGHRSSVIGH